VLIQSLSSLLRLLPFSSGSSSFFRCFVFSSPLPCEKTFLFFLFFFFPFEPPPSWGRVGREIMGPMRRLNLPSPFSPPSLRFFPLPSFFFPSVVYLPSLKTTILGRESRVLFFFPLFLLVVTFSFSLPRGRRSTGR